MKSWKFYGLISFLILCFCKRVQARPQELFTKKDEDSKNRDLMLNNYEQTKKDEDYLLPPSIPQNLEITLSPNATKMLDLLTKPENSANFELKTHKLHDFLKSAKSYNPRSEPTKSENPLVDNKALNISENHPKVGKVILLSSDSQKIYCRQVMNSKSSTQGDKINSLLHICESPTKEALTSPPRSLSKKEKIEHILIFHPAQGFNCRRFMNSELNSKGQIVDYVWDVCDAPTTTTTTTRRPIFTTPRIIMTTPKPKVKVCRPHMNSYVNDQGQIVDGVTVLCKMEEVK